MKFKKEFKTVILAVSVLSIFIISLGANRSKVDYKDGKNLDIFFNIFRDVSLMYVDSIDSDRMIEVAANAMLSELDPYTQYMPAKEYSQFEASTSGKYGGMGALIQKKNDDEYGEISEPFENCPAQKAGLVAGDKLVKIDGVDIKNSTSSEISEKLKGEPGSSFKLEILSWLDGTTKEVTIKRELVKIPAVPYYTIVDSEKGVGYISLTTFSENCSKEVRDAVASMQKSGNLKSLILDLRNNGGGIMDEAVSIVSLFVDKNTEVVSMRGRLYKESKVYKTKQEPIAKDLPLVVLVNGNSASASEIVSGSLQDLDRAVIMGEKSFGKGLVQTTREVGYGGVVKVTTAKYYIPSGRCIQAVDFSHKDKNGDANSVADSLRNEFKTKNGRVVYDGGGIDPDVKVDADKMSKFTVYASSMGYCDDFAKLYFKNNRTAPDIATFSITDKDLNDFADFLKEKDFKIESYTEYYLKKLKASAEKDRLNEKLSQTIADMEEALKIDIREQVELNRADLKKIIESSIITKYHYQKGTSQFLVEHDPVIKKAAKVAQKASAVVQL